MDEMWQQTFFVSIPSQEFPPAGRYEKFYDDGCPGVSIPSQEFPPAGEKHGKNSALRRMWCFHSFSGIPSCRLREAYRLIFWAIKAFPFLLRNSLLQAKELYEGPWTPETLKFPFLLRNSLLQDLKPLTLTLNEEQVSIPSQEFPPAGPGLLVERFTIFVSIPSQEFPPAGSKGLHSDRATYGVSIPSQEFPPAGFGIYKPGLIRSGVSIPSQEFPPAGKFVSQTKKPVIYSFHSFSGIPSCRMIYFHRPPPIVGFPFLLRNSLLQELILARSPQKRKRVSIPSQEFPPAGV